MKRILITPQFMTVGNTANEIRLGDIKPISSSTVGNGKVIIYTLLNSGKTDQTYIWNGSKWMHSGKDATEETIPEGKGLWVLCNMAATVSVSLQSAGEVNTTDDIVFLLNGGMKRTAVGNGFPSEVTFSNIVPEAVTDGQTIGNGKVIVYTLLNSGRTDQTYIWNGSKWMHSGKDASAETVPAGKGLWVLCNIAEATTRVNLRIKNPLAK